MRLEPTRSAGRDKGGAPRHKPPANETCVPVDRGSVEEQGLGDERASVCGMSADAGTVVGKGPRWRSRRCFGTSVADPRSSVSGLQRLGSLDPGG